MAAVAEIAASSPSSWCIWVAKLEKRVTAMKNHNSNFKEYEKVFTFQEGYLKQNQNIFEIWYPISNLR